MTNSTNFVDGRTGRGLCRMTLPVAAAMFLNMAYNLVDSLWIGNLLGETAYAALSAATPILLLLNAAAMGAANGVSILLSQAAGARDTRRIDGLIATSTAAAALFSAGTALLLEGTLHSLLALLQTPAEALPLAAEYLSVHLLGYPAVFLYCHLGAVARSFGNAVYQMAAMLLCTLLNAALDPLFIHGMGFRGAALATLLSQSACLACMARLLARRRLFRLRRGAVDRSLIVPLLARCLPAVVQQGIPAVSAAALTALAGGFGVTALAAYGVAGKLETILFYPAMSLNMALTTIVGQCSGAGRPDRARDYLRCALWTGGGILLILSAVVIRFARPLAGLFLPGGEAAALTAAYFQVVSVGYVLNTVTNCFLGALNGMGHPGESMLCMALYYLAVRIPLAYGLAALGLDGIWAAVLVSHVIAALAASVAGTRQLRAAAMRPSATPSRQSPTLSTR